VSRDRTSGFRKRRAELKRRTTMQFAIQIGGEKFYPTHIIMMQDRDRKLQKAYKKGFGETEVLHLACDGVENRQTIAEAQEEGWQVLCMIMPGEKGPGSWYPKYIIKHERLLPTAESLVDSLIAVNNSLSTNQLVN